MAAAVTATYGGSTVTAGETAVHITCDDVDSNTTTGYNSSNYPASPAVTYYFSAEKSGQDSLVSHVFTTDSGGAARWDGLVLPAAGTWAVHIRKVSDDSSVASVNVTVV